MQDKYVETTGFFAQKSVQLVVIIEFSPFQKGASTWGAYHLIAPFFVVEIVILTRHSEEG
jgi:hypothetical protein